MWYKLRTAINKNKANLIIYAILWLILTIGLVIPIAYGIVNATVNGMFSMTEFVPEFMKAYSKFGEVLQEIMTAKYLGTFINTLLKVSLVYLILVIIALIKSKSGGEYRDIEHGSSDWCEGGEQYSVLSNKKGIILAENNYLPLDKRGNVNVLIVGRFRFW